MKKIFLKLSISALAVFICLTIIELVLRLFWINPVNYIGATDESLFWQYDSLLGWYMLPNQRGKFIRPEFETTITTNSLGIRDDEMPSQKPKNEKRILLLGDSVVSGFEVEKDSTMEACLERLLNARHDGKHYLVINGGFRGYGTDQELLFLQYRGMLMQPDMVILAFVPANDPENNVTVHTAGRKYAKPYFVYGKHRQLTLQGVPVQKNPTDKQIYSPLVRQFISLQKNRLLPSSASKTRPLRKFLSEHFYLYGFIANRLKSANPKVVSWLQKHNILHRTLTEAYVNFYRNPPPPAWRKRWQITLDLILQIKRICKKADLPLLVWMFPLKEKVYKRDKEIFMRSYGLDTNEIDFNLPEKKLKAFCQKNKIRFISPVARFKKRAALGYRMHYLSDNHFNAMGHKLMADILLDELSLWNLPH